MDARAGGKRRNHLVVAVVLDAQEGLGLVESDRLDRGSGQENGGHVVFSWVRGD